jgi:hypothetical protein
MFNYGQILNVGEDQVAAWLELEQHATVKLTARRTGEVGCVNSLCCTHKA